MDKRVGIVTWFRNPNHGSVLQAYALQKVLGLMGYDSEFIDYSRQTSCISHRLWRRLKDIAILALRPQVHHSRKKIYKFIEGSLQISQPYRTYAQLVQEADRRYWAAICGSDQIWSNNGGRVDPFYYLAFIQESKRIAYAPSIGYNRVPDELLGAFTEYVNGVRFLSVREAKGAALIKQTTGRDAGVVLDPSLLLAGEQWRVEAAAADRPSPRHRYLLCYFRSRNAEYASHVRRVANARGLAVTSVGAEVLSLTGAAKVVPDPLAFVDLIANADFILTDAFHGTAFSINLGKQFAVLKRFADDDPISQNSRVDNILHKTGLCGRMLVPGSTVDTIIAEDIDYRQVWPLLEAERQESLRYLRDALNAVSSI